MANVKPARGLLLVRPIETSETMPGGRVLLTQDTRERLTAHQCEVVAHGGDALCEHAWRGDIGECERLVHEHERDEPPQRVTHPSFVAVGDWLLVQPRSFKEGPEPERREWFVHQDDVIGVFQTPTPTASPQTPPTS